MYKIWDESNPKKEDLIFAIDPDLQVLQNFIKFCSLKLECQGHTFVSLYIQCVL